MHFCLDLTFNFSVFHCDLKLLNIGVPLIRGSSKSVPGIGTETIILTFGLPRKAMKFNLQPPPYIQCVVL